MKNKGSKLIIFSILFILFLFISSTVNAEIFGDNTHSSYVDITAKKYYIGSMWTSGSEGGTADSITTYCKSTTNNWITMAIYTGSLGGALTKIGQTECKQVNQNNAWVTWNFTTTVNIDANTDYHLVSWGDNGGGGFEISGDNSPSGHGTWQYYYAGNGCITMKSPLTMTLLSSAYQPEIYCTYTVGSNDLPTQSNHTVWDGTTEKSLNATDVSIPLTCFNVTVNDVNGDLMNISVLTNASGSWKTINQTGSGMSNGTYHAYNTSWVTGYGTTYYLAFNVSDNDDYVNETYKFTTIGNNKPVQSNHVLWCNSCGEEFLFNQTNITKYIDSINVTVNDSDGENMDVHVYTNASGSWKLVNETSGSISNGTFISYNTSWIDSYATKYFVSFNVTDGKEWVNETHNFTTKDAPVGGCDCDEIQAMLDDLKSQLEEGDNVISIDGTQFVIFIQLILFCIFIWLGYSIPAMNGNNRSIHMMPFSGGLFVLFGALDFISLSIVLTGNYSLGIIGGFLTTVGVVLLIYGILKAFYYDGN